MRSIVLVVGIDTFSTPATDLTFPAVTVCRNKKYDVGEYLRAIYNNFEYSCSESLASPSCLRTAKLREDFAPLSSSESVVPVRKLLGCLLTKFITAQLNRAFSPTTSCPRCTFGRKRPTNSTISFPCKHVSMVTVLMLIERIGVIFQSIRRDLFPT